MPNFSIQPDNSGFFRKGRIFIEKIEKEETAWTKGVRHHNWISALFRCLFGGIKVLRSTDGKVYYVNKTSLRHWKERQYKKHQLKAQKKETLEDSIQRIIKEVKRHQKKTTKPPSVVKPPEPTPAPPKPKITKVPPGSKLRMRDFDQQYFTSILKEMGCTISKTKGEKSWSVQIPESWTGTRTEEPTTGEKVYRFRDKEKLHQLTVKGELGSDESLLFVSSRIVNIPVTNSASLRTQYRMAGLTIPITNDKSHMLYELPKGWHADYSSISEVFVYEGSGLKFYIESKSQKEGFPLPKNNLDAISFLTDKDRQERRRLKGEI